VGEACAVTGFPDRHVTKEGAIAVTGAGAYCRCGVYLEGEPLAPTPAARVKNRFGSNNEIGVFEMKGRDGGNSNPSAIFSLAAYARSGRLGYRLYLEGSRPPLVEVQALTNTDQFRPAAASS